MIALGAGAPAAKAADLGGDCCSDLEERVAELEATTARKGNRKVSLTISGQVTTALMAWDNGASSDVYVVDPPTAGGTLFNLTGSAKISPSLSAGFHIQIGLDKGARSHQVTQSDDDAGGGDDFRHRALVVADRVQDLQPSGLGKQAEIFRDGSEHFAQLVDPAWSG